MSEGSRNMIKHVTFSTIKIFFIFGQKCISSFFFCNFSSSVYGQCGRYADEFSGVVRGLSMYVENLLEELVDSVLRVPSRPMNT